MSLKSVFGTHSNERSMPAQEPSEIEDFDGNPDGWEAGGIFGTGFNMPSVANSSASLSIIPHNDKGKTKGSPAELSTYPQPPTKEKEAKRKALR